MCMRRVSHSKQLLLSYSSSNVARIKRNTILAHHHHSTGQSIPSKLFNLGLSSVKMVSTQLETSPKSSNLNARSMTTIRASMGDETMPTLKDQQTAEYKRAIQDLNLLQSNTQVLALAKYKNPEAILPLFRRQMRLAGLELDDLKLLKCIHVSGTKGKGSTCAFTESILRQAGLRTGFYNSPHLIKVTERIQLNGRPIESQLFAKYFRQVFDRLLAGTKHEGISMPSYFSFLTILAFHIFLSEQVDCAVIEVGMGGEYDPTNVIEQPVACGITTLDFDHTNVLGKTIESIAWNKAGIIKEGSPVFTIDHEQKEAMRVVEQRARDRRAPVQVCKPFNPNSLDLGIQSPAQYANAALACHLVRCFLQDEPSKYQLTDQLNLDELPEYYRRGLVACQWPGRCQTIQYDSKMCFFLDGAHTRKSMVNCLEWYLSSSRKTNPDAQQILMVNVIGDRDKVEVLRPLTNHHKFTHVIFSTNRINTAGDTPKSETFVNLLGPNNEKSLDNVKSNVRAWESLVTTPKTEVLTKPNIYAAIKAVEQISDKQCHILATGSLHFVGAVLETMAFINDEINQ